jgi:UDP-GlcNAc:undecaprenyl-phosphate GlcNAc-1-phosphate transferase
MATYVCMYLESVLLAVVTTPIVIRIARRVGALDRGSVRGVHEKPTPRIGGAAIFLSAMVPIISVLFLGNRIGETFRAVWLQVGALLCMATLIFLIGLVDDLRGLPARVKFLAEIVAAGMLCFVGIRINALNVTDGYVLRFGLLSYPLTILWIVGITNAVNLSDGLDGLAAGVSAVACAVIAVFALYNQDLIMAALMLALLGGLCGFLFYNFNPAKTFMGDCGSLFVGFTIAASSVMCLAKSSALVGLALPALALGIPIFDTLFSMLRRFLERRSLFAPDRGHFHHRLIDLGLKQRHAVIAIYAATCGATGLGLFMMVRHDTGALIVFACILLLLVLLFRVVGAVQFGQTILKLQQKHALAVREKAIQRAFENLQLQFRQVHNRDQWWQALCDAGKSFDFDSVSLITKDGDGQADTKTWRRPKPSPGDSRIITMNLPLSHGDSQKEVECQIAITAEPSLEWAGRKGALFSRLVDEHDLTGAR